MTCEVNILNNKTVQYAHMLLLFFELVLCRYCSILPGSKDMNIELIGNSKLSTGVEDCCDLLATCPGYSHTLPLDSCNRLQHPAVLSAGEVVIENKWMDNSAVEVFADSAHCVVLNSN